MCSFSILNINIDCPLTLIPLDAALDKLLKVLPQFDAAVTVKNVVRSLQT